MPDDDKRDLPPLAAGGDRTGDDPEAQAFEERSARSAGDGPKPEPSTTGPAPAGKAAGKPAAEGSTAGEGEERRVFVGTGLFWGLIVGVVLAVLVIIFSAQNTQDTTVKLFAWDWSSRLFVVILISLIVGIVLDEIVGLALRARRRRRLAEKEELHRLRGKK